MTNSNTTLVKVKSFVPPFVFFLILYSNTTLVKVKLDAKQVLKQINPSFKYNTC